MALWAIIPVKPLRRGKSRLAKVISAEERADLNHYLLKHTIQVLSTIKEIENILVISRDTEALALARDLGARTVQEYGSPGLNTALSRAVEIAKSYGTCGILVVPADLPRLDAEDIKKILIHKEKPPVVVIAPDRKREGTNALLICPPDLIEFKYGIGSFEKHSQAARDAGVRLEICDLPSLELDLDEPEDLALIEAELKINE
ncbi:MAG: 2-phospho-L-lactate guanylyltransferase [Anaerolineales bacterium]|nr:MAG: 2-phospho-L-lactate guanylyltransferase [Anaerolineales bacterium]